MFPTRQQAAADRGPESPTAAGEPSARQPVPGTLRLVTSVLRIGAFFVPVFAIMIADHFLVRRGVYTRGLLVPGRRDESGQRSQHLGEQS